MKASVAEQFDPITVAKAGNYIVTNQNQVIQIANDAYTVYNFADIAYVGIVEEVNKAGIASGRYFISLADANKKTIKGTYHSAFGRGGVNLKLKYCGSREDAAEIANMIVNNVPSAKML